MFLLPQKILNQKITELNENYKKENFFKTGGYILFIKKILFNWQIKKKNNNLKCVKTKKHLLILPKKYFKTIKKYFDFKNSYVHISYNNLILIDKKKLKIYKTSFNKIGWKNLENNYKSLKRTVKLNAPYQISTAKDNGIFISRETFLLGNQLILEKINKKILINIINSLSEFYLENKKSEIFDLKKELNSFDNLIKYYPKIWEEKINLIKKIIFEKNKKNNFCQIFKTKIHGDLTYKNILLYNNQFYFIDWDRSRTSFPEFDIWLFKIHSLIYKKGKPSYELLVDYIFKLIRKEINVKELNYFYDSKNDFKVNLEITDILKYLFLFRIIVLSLQNFYKDKKMPMDLLNLTIFNLKNKI